MNDVDIRIVAGRPYRGRYPVSLMQGNTVLCAGQVNPHRPEEIEDFVQNACSELPSLKEKAEEVRHELLQLAARSPSPDAPGFGAGSNDCPYLERDDGGLAWIKSTSSGSVTVDLTNFTARIVAEVMRDDGTEQEITFEIEARLGDRTDRFTVAAPRFSAMNWPVEHLGASAIVNAGQSTKDHARAAIQFLSGKDIVRLVMYVHTGWREVTPGKYAYLHGDGAIGPDGAMHSVRVELLGPLALYTLPNPPEGPALVEAIKASLRILELGPREITVPAFCAVWRAAIGPCDFGIHFSGPSGVFKSEKAALVQQFFGAAMDARHLPGSWHSTDNALEGLLFAAKDAVTVVDDFAPGGGPNDVARWHQRADRIVRAQGNNSARSRMRSDGTLRPPKPPRGLTVSTGEEIPRGHSLRARLFTLEVSRGDIDPNRLTLCQRDARNGLYASAMAGYLRYLAPRIGEVQISMRAEIERLRGDASAADSHCRTPEIIANLALGLRQFLDYAQDAGALSPDEAETLWAEGWAALIQAGKSQLAHQIANEPAARFMELLKSAMASGHAHLAGRDGAAPGNPGACGWRKVRYGSNEEWQPQGSRVGWVDGESIYLDPDASYKAAQEMAGHGDGLAVSARTLRKRLCERSWLIRDQSRQQTTVRRKLEGSQREVIHLTPNAHLLDTDATTQPAEDYEGPWEDA